MTRVRSKPMEFIRIDRRNYSQNANISQQIDATSDNVNFSARPALA